MPPGPLSQSLSPPSLMRRMVSTCEAQLAAAYAHNVHSVGATKALLDWLDAVKAACGRPLTQRETSHWRGVFSQFYESMDREDRRVNEGGFVIRFISWLQPRLQRRWYLKVYGKILSADHELTTDPDEHGELFHRPTIPRTMSPPVVPSVLPFNTVSASSLHYTAYCSRRIVHLLAFSAHDTPYFP